MEVWFADALPDSGCAGLRVTGAVRGGTLSGGGKRGGSASIVRLENAQVASDGPRLSCAASARGAERKMIQCANTTPAVSSVRRQKAGLRVAGTGLVVVMQ